MSAALVLHVLSEILMMNASAKNGGTVSTGVGSALPASPVVKYLAGRAYTTAGVFYGNPRVSVVAVSVNATGKVSTVHHAALVLGLAEAVGGYNTSNVFTRLDFRHDNGNFLLASCVLVVVVGWDVVRFE
eukprot:CAMPEP_0116831802 /NCGR_PEP_ID=MMETSP0418-20121206/5541_1 /TAXON_ID=1158023 /ORGANISM="Astrosyne radiata, Strain 13vi08-1A" /LENGTH=129 /DNA_ID=CAMNT_0004461097 /DNA_START=66 /DNA_END=451 /DNA_ORIENTATION=+